MSSTKIHTLTTIECHQLLQHLLIEAGTQNQFKKGIRNYCIALLMLDAGLRVGEVASLKICDLLICDSPTQTLILTAEVTKNNRERSVPTSSRLQMAIKTMNVKWWTDPILPLSSYAFHVVNSKVNLTIRQIQRIIGHASKQAFGRTIHPHALRHTFASRLMKRTSMRVVQELLGHKSITSTQVYTHPDSDDLTSAIASLSE